jgi:hypothetical protein
MEGLRERVRTLEGVIQDAGLDPDSLVEAYATLGAGSGGSGGSGGAAAPAGATPLGQWMDAALLAPVDVPMPGEKLAGADGLHPGHNVVAVAAVGTVPCGDGTAPVLVRGRATVPCACVCMRVPCALNHAPCACRVCLGLCLRRRACGAPAFLAWRPVARCAMEQVASGGADRRLVLSLVTGGAGVAGAWLPPLCAFTCPAPVLCLTTHPASLTPAHPGGALLAVGLMDGGLLLVAVDVKPGATAADAVATAAVAHSVRDHTKFVTRARWSRDGSRLATGSYDHHAGLYEVVWGAEDGGDSGGVVVTQALRRQFTGEWPTPVPPPRSAPVANCA